MSSFKIEHIAKRLRAKLAPHQCNYCGEGIYEFEFHGFDAPVLQKYDVIGAGKRKCACPACGSHDRIRLLLYYFRNHSNLFRSGGYRHVVHIAPELHIYEILSKQAGIEYTCGDLFPEASKLKDLKKIDVTKMHFENNSVDWFICNHVLEHVPTDRIAMEEIFRVLKPGGMAVLQVPISETVETTYEDSTVTSEKERFNAFGQEDHVRIYGKDYLERLKSVGFKLKVFNTATEIPSRVVKKFGLNNREKIFAVEK